MNVHLEVVIYESSLRKVILYNVGLELCFQGLLQSSVFSILLGDSQAIFFKEW